MLKDWSNASGIETGKRGQMQIGFLKGLIPVQKVL
jgi:hypothetical protein